jgi:hypothetical protein
MAMAISVGLRGGLISGGLRYSRIGGTVNGNINPAQPQSQQPMSMHQRSGSRQLMASAFRGGILAWRPISSALCRPPFSRLKAVRLPLGTLRTTSPVEQKPAANGPSQWRTGVGLEDGWLDWGSGGCGWKVRFETMVADGWTLRRDHRSDGRGEAGKGTQHTHSPNSARPHHHRLALQSPHQPG